MPEKCLERVPVHMPETLKRELQDLAMLDDRTVGEYSRRVLELRPDIYPVEDHQQAA